MIERSMDYPLVSIIIPAKKFNENLNECVKHCLDLDYPNCEIMVLPDSPSETSYLGATVIPTGAVGPSEKRDMAIPKAKGDLLAFLDDDAFPRRDWLKNATRRFDDPKIAAVGGPAITPESDTLRQKASGLVYSSRLASGPYVYRHVPRKLREVDDYPSCNFIVRRSIVKEIGGFKTKFWPGEDTSLCLEITKKLGKKIIYDPEVIVYHHRRKLFIPHLKQVKRYSLHRGYFAKRFPKTSFRLAYFFPSIFVMGLLVGGILSLFYPIIRFFYFGTIGLYLLLVILSVPKGKELKAVPVAFMGIILTNIWYGIWFIKGLFSKRLEEE